MCGGLSPQVRGNRIIAGRIPFRIGSIPAGAGEPVERHENVDMGGVYPRRCGGTLTVSTTYRVIAGLSPQVRGNLGGNRRVPRDCGSIPAGAGEPVQPELLGDPTRVYPRRCGGTVIMGDTTFDGLGLSPQVRGNRSIFHPWMIFSGSIPAGAGEPPRCGRGGWRAGVYPRRCGGTFWNPRCRRQINGLSPQVRGNRKSGAPHSQKGGSIPAGAGEP